MEALVCLTCKEQDPSYPADLLALDEAARRRAGPGEPASKRQHKAWAPTMRNSQRSVLPFRLISRTAAELCSTCMTIDGLTDKLLCGGTTAEAMSLCQEVLCRPVLKG